MSEHIKKLAEQAGLSREFAVSGLWLADDEELERFAKLVRQDEREACAKLCEELSTKWYDEGGSSRDCVHAIRARGNHEQD
jgi:hypothetical protein